MWLLLTCLVVVFQGTSTSAQSSKIDTDAIDTVVKKEMRDQKIVGLAIAIIGKGKVLYSKGYGFADLEEKTEVGTSTVFNWASNSKPVMAIAAMQLVESGDLDLDASVSDYVPNLPAEWKDITTRHLLCHQSGIPHYRNGKVVPSGTEFTPEEELDPMNTIHRFTKSPLLFTPGTKSEYSSYAYILLTAVVQAAGKKPIAQQLTERITEPLKMDSFQLDMPFADQPNWSKGYRIVNGKPVELADEPHAWKHGAGAYKSSIDDFAKFTIGMMKSRLVKSRTSSKMWKGQQLASEEKTVRGLGVTVSGKGDKLKVSHGGSQSEVTTRMVMYPKKRHGIVVLCNTDDINIGRVTTNVYKVLVAN